MQREDQTALWLGDCRLLSDGAARLLADGQVHQRVGLGGWRQGAHRCGVHDEAVATFRVGALVDHLAQDGGRLAAVANGRAGAAMQAAVEHRGRFHAAAPAQRAARPAGSVGTAGRAAIHASTSASRQATQAPCSCTGPGKSPGLDFGVNGAAAQAGDEAHVIDAEQALAVGTRLKGGRLCGGWGGSGRRFWHVPMFLWGHAKAKKH